MSFGQEAAAEMCRLLITARHTVEALPRYAREAFISSQNVSFKLKQRTARGMLFRGTVT